MLMKRTRMIERLLFDPLLPPEVSIEKPTSGDLDELDHLPRLEPACAISLSFLDEGYTPAEFIIILKRTVRNA